MNLRVPILSRRRSLVLRAIRAGLVVLALIAAGTVVGPGSTLAQPSGSPSGSPSVVQQPKGATPITADIRESLDYLMSKFKVTEAEALRRLQLQARAAGITDQLRGRLGEELLDVWLDQENGGLLTFLTSRPAEAQAAMGAAYDPAQIRIVRSKHTAAELAIAESAVRARLTGLNDALVGTDRHNEKIVVHYPKTDQRRAAEIRGRAGTVAGNRVAVSVDTSGPPPPGQQRYCYILMCDPPMRGGIRLHIKRDDGSFGSCTTGFNVRDSNGWVYVLTAGHCVTLPGPGRQYAYHNGLPVAWEKSTTNDADPSSPANTNYSNNDYPRYDWALMPYSTDGNQWSAYWLNSRDQHNLVNADCVSPSNKSCSSATRAMTGLYTWEQIGVGWVVCATGSGTSVIYPGTNTGYSPGTRCGSIKDKYMTDYCYSCSWPWGWGLKVDICSRPGDSGGPLYSQIDSKAYGILSGGPSRSGACDMSNHDEFSVYSPLSEILNNAKARTGITMNLITSASG